MRISDVDMWCLRFLLVVLAAVTMTLQQEWDSNCPKYCKCKWISSKKTADCAEGHLNAVPSTLSSAIQTLDLSRNSIAELPKFAFKEVSLVNLHKLYLKSCGIYEIHKDAFEGLKILIELNLEDNNIQKLDPTTFRRMDRLRILTLINNRLEIVPEGMLSNLFYLQTVDLSKNNLTYVSPKAFTNAPKLQFVILNDNNLKQMEPLILGPNQKLGSLILHNNPWICDCHLKSFRNWTMEYNLFTAPTACREPNRLRDRLWSDIPSEEFACKPVILEPETGATITLRNDKEKTISCKVYGDPVPAVNWVLNNRIIETDRRGDDKHFIIRENGYETTRWVNLTIRNPRPQDRGELICSATNPGGVEERNVTVYLSSGILPGLDSDSNPVLLPLILGIVIGVFLLFVILIFLFYCLWRRKKLPSKNEANRSNGGANLDDTEMEKSLITAVNPVTKPPRRCEAPPSVASCGTEMSEINRTLLDNDSVFNPTNCADEESHSLEFIESNNPKIGKELPAHAEYARSDRPYPPDLLSFSARTSQISPAGSCASTIPDYSRHPAPHGPQSPIHSPIYGTLPSNLFRTLPYSRSHSPFTSPGCVPVQSRQGYVTIPRRPRVPSWSAPTSTPGNEVVEPVYDNLGLRTTADGSSVLSLNKSVEPSPIGMRGRPLPATPIYQQNGLPMYYTPIEEHESPPAPCPAPRPPSARGGSLQRLPTSPCPPSEVGIRDSWVSRTGPEGASMGMLTPNEEAGLSGSISPTPSSLNGTLGRSPKVPPKPPPKPKKKSVVSGPLFEDEGEDGTEV